MKAFLLSKDQDVDLQQPLPSNAEALIQDLELDTLFQGMARGDPFLFEVAKKVVLSSLTNLDTIHYRQQVLQDCLNNAAVIRELYAVAGEAIAGEKKVWGVFRDYPTGILHRAVEVLEIFVGVLKKLRQIADAHAERFVSEGCTTFFAMLQRELDDAYFAAVQQHLKTLKFRRGVLMSAKLGKGNKGTSYVLRTPPDQPQRLLERLFADRPTTYSFTIAERDESGARALSELQDRGINLVANCNLTDKPAHTLFW